MPRPRPTALQKRLAQWRREIVRARIELACLPLTDQQQNDLWLTVDCREWFIKMTAASFEEELEQIDRDIEAKLRHPSS